jgi:endonuclease/exonuclease/phosphatase family metal-dependent hydrolase
MTKLKILSFNILAEQFIDYDNPSEYYPKVPVSDLKEENRLPKIFAFLQKNDPDIMLLQEVNPKVLKMLQLNLAESHMLMPLAEHHTEESLMEGNDYGNLIAVRHGMFDEFSYRTIFVPKLGSAFALLTCKLKADLSKEFLIINIHLDADEESEDNRKIEVNMLMKLIKNLLKKSITIITGDFNTNSPIIHNKFKKLTPVVRPDKPVGTYLNDPLMIDWIYIKNANIVSGKVLKPSDATNATPLKKFGSDHYPVVAEIEI